MGMIHYYLLHCPILRETTCASTCYGGWFGLGCLSSSLVVSCMDIWFPSQSTVFQVEIEQVPDKSEYRT